MEEKIIRSENDINLILEKIKFIWKHYPDQRLGQLLCSSANYGALYYSTDDDLIKILEQKYAVDTSRIDLPVEKPMEDRLTTYELEMQKMRELIVALQATSKKPSANKGRIYIHRSGQTKSINASDFKDYARDGWEKGRGPRS